MTEDIQKLISSLRLGEHENPLTKIELLTAALIEQSAGLNLLLDLLQAPQIPLQLAAIGASRSRTEPELVSALLSLVRHPEQRIRLKLVEVLAPRTGKSCVNAMQELIGDAESDVRAASLKATAGRPEFRLLQESALTRDSDWDVRYAALHALESQKTPLVVRCLIQTILLDDRSDIGRRCAELIEKRLTHSSGNVEKQLPTDIAALSRLEARLRDHDVHRFPKLAGWLESRTRVELDPTTLTRFGTDLTLLAASGSLPRAHHVEEACETVLKLIQRTPPRSIALVGPAGVGKSALVNELVYRLAGNENGGWHVLRVSPSDFMAGTKYLGEWETKVRELVEAVRRPRKVLLYIPNLSDLSSAGTWSKSDSNVATALAPYMEDGSVVILGETAPEEFERGLGRLLSVRRLFDQVLVTEPSPEHTRSILTAVRDEERSRIGNEILDQISEVSAQFLGNISRPGGAVELLRAAIRHEREFNRLLVYRDILTLLSRSTGIPADLLDDGVPLRQGEVREFFEKKIIGQPQAIDAVVDLVTLIKAGVTDPHRPFGVFLFAGPTGVGKTELARALAEYIFGDPGRLKRFDMSEFANPEGFTRLIGTPAENGLLTDSVRQQPFSVVLLDEIEKGHLNVFDLCLQIFDAGRLTDGRGRTVDFRRTIIILTSNVGSTGGLLGFNTEAEQSQPSDRAAVPRELSRFFRPEFLNRLDRIIQFRPLSLEVAERIARREIESVLQRSGIRRRELVVDIDPRVVSLVVREGYSAHFGARPLKRTVERLLLLPIARTIAAGSLRGRTLLRLTEHGGRVQAVVTAASSKREAAVQVQTAGLSTTSMEDLHARFAGLEEPIRTFSARKSDLILQSGDPAFFRNPQVRTSALDEIHNLDQFINLYHEVGRTLRAMAEPRGRDSLARAGEAARREKLAHLDQELEYLAFVARCRDATDLGDALLTITLVDRAGRSQDAAQIISGMYRGLAARRRMTSDVLGEFYKDRQDMIHLLIAGLGAFGFLKNESGLHQVDRRYKHRDARSNREVLLEDRELLRVETHPAADPPAEFRQQVKARTSVLKPVKKRLLTADVAVTLFHEPTLRSMDLWTTGPKEAAIGRGLFVLNAHLRDNAAGGKPDAIIRQYDFGIGPKIRDNRTGRSTTRVKQVLKGNVEPLLSLQRDVPK